MNYKQQIIEAGIQMASQDLTIETWGNATEYGLAHEGVICLQDHGDPASFRNIKIKELPRKAGQEVELFNGKDLHGWELFGSMRTGVDEEVLGSF